MYFDDNHIRLGSCLKTFLPNLSLACCRGDTLSCQLTSKSDHISVQSGLHACTHTLLMFSIIRLFILIFNLKEYMTLVYGNNWNWKLKVCSFYFITINHVGSNRKWSEVQGKTCCILEHLYLEEQYVVFLNFRYLKIAKSCVLKPILHMRKQIAVK